MSGLLSEVAQWATVGGDCGPALTKINQLVEIIHNGLQEPRVPRVQGMDNQDGLGRRSETSTTPHISQDSVDSNHECRENGQMMDGAVQPCIPKIQLYSQNGNKNPIYLAMLGRIGLDSPTKSIVLRDSHTQSGDNHEMENSISTRLRDNKVKPQHLGQYRYSPRNGRIVKDKRKSPLGRK